jgi:glycosyltransferase involved in cell wall biosynthesis
VIVDSRALEKQEASVMNIETMDRTKEAVWPMISLLVPVFNEVDFIGECIAGIQRQDYVAEKLEVILVDGGSTDGTREAIRQHIDADARLRLLDNPQRVQPCGVNIGVREAKGEIIVRFDAHTVYPANYIRRCVEVLRETGADVVGGAVRSEPSGPGLIAGAIAACGHSRFGLGGARFRVGGQAGVVDTVPYGAYRREVFERVGFLNERLIRAEDLEFNGRVRAAGMTIYFDPSITSTLFARPTIAGFMKQQYGNGYYHFLTLTLNPNGCSARHFIPFVFVATLLICGLAGFLWSAFWWLGAAVLGFYLAVALMASIAASAREGWRYMLVLPWLFPPLHAAYGVATLVGAFRLVILSQAARWCGIGPKNHTKHCQEAS